MKQLKSTAAPRWNPYQTFIWTTKEMKAWVDTYGEWGQWDGKRWKMIAARLCPGRYTISFKDYDR